MKNLIVFPLLISFLSSCVAPIFFEESQPSFVEKEERFPEPYLGEYLNYEDSANLTILERTILIDADWTGNETPDTLFHLSNSNVLKHYKGKYFLNYKDLENDWALHLIELNGDMLSFYCLNLPEDEEKMEKFGSIRKKKDECDEVVKLVIRPTKKGFKKLLKKKNLIRISVYSKLNNE